MKLEFKTFRSKLADILDIDENELVPDYKVDESNVDSLARLSLAALVVELFAIELEGNSLDKCKNYSDLLDLIKNKIKLKDA